MDFENAWGRALKNTEIIRSRVQALLTYDDTHVPYILLSESSVNVGDTVVRRGEVVIAKPSLILPPNIPQFEGFELNQGEGVNENAFINFLLVRGVTLPSMMYNNKTYSLDLFEDKLTNAIRHYKDMLQSEENVHTGLVVAPEDGWQFSLLIFICSQVARNADVDIRKLLDDFKKKLN